MARKQLTTYEEFTRNPEQKKLLDAEYLDLVLSELVHAIRAGDWVTAQRLVKEL